MKKKHDILTELIQFIFANMHETNMEILYSYIFKGKENQKKNNMIY